MTTKTMTADEEGLAALAKAFGQIPASMQRVLLGVAKQMRAVAEDNASTVAKLESETEARRHEFEAAAAESARLADRVDVLADQNRALSQEAASLRQMNHALLDERAAFQAVEASVARFADQKRQVDALLRAAGADTQGTGDQCETPNEYANTSTAYDVEEPVDAPGEGPSAVPAESILAAERALLGEPSDPLAQRTEGGTGGRRAPEHSPVTG